MTAKAMVAGVKKRTRDWKYDVISLGYPGPVLRGCPKADPRNLAPGWVGFDFEAAFERPVKIINDAAMQALGSYNGGTMLFLGLGTGLGSALIIEMAPSLRWNWLTFLTREEATRTMSAFAD